MINSWDLLFCSRLNDLIFIVVWWKEFQRWTLSVIIRCQYRIWVHFSIEIGRSIEGYLFIVGDWYARWWCIETRGMIAVFVMLMFMLNCQYTIIWWWRRSINTLILSKVTIQWNKMDSRLFLRMDEYLKMFGAQVTMIDRLLCHQMECSRCS